MWTPTRVRHHALPPLLGYSSALMFMLCHALHSPAGSLLVMSWKRKQIRSYYMYQNDTVTTVCVSNFLNVTHSCAICCSLHIYLYKPYSVTSCAPNIFQFPFLSSALSLSAEVRCVQPLANYPSSRWPRKWADILFMRRKIHFAELSRDQVTLAQILTLDNCPSFKFHLIWIF